MAISELGRRVMWCAAARSGTGRGVYGIRGAVTVSGGSWGVVSAAGMLSSGDGGDVCPVS